MFERYTEGARRSLFFARFEASRLGSLSIEPEHLLLGLIRQPQDASLVRLQLPLDAIRQAIENQTALREKVDASVEIPFGGQLRRLFERAAAEADRIGQHDIHSGHLLLGILREEGGPAARVLAEHGVSLDAVRASIARARDEDDDAGTQAGQ